MTIAKGCRVDHFKYREKILASMLSAGVFVPARLGVAYRTEKQLIRVGIIELVHCPADLAGAISWASGANTNEATAMISAGISKLIELGVINAHSSIHNVKETRLYRLTSFGKKLANDNILLNRYTVAGLFSRSSKAASKLREYAMPMLGLLLEYPGSSKIDLLHAAPKYGAYRLQVLLELAYVLRDPVHGAYHITDAGREYYYATDQARCTTVPPTLNDK